jgi:Ni2+-binding GTPase involved in maturation of urease and hydrogenase
MCSNIGGKMKLAIFGGTPGSGKTSVIKHVIEELGVANMHFAKFDVLHTDDDTVLEEKFGISTEKKISGDVCPDHYAALELSKILQKYSNKEFIFVETAGLCLRCSPYVFPGLGINVLNITAGNPSSYGPLLTHADIVAITKGDLVSQAEREIFMAGVLKVNPNAAIIESNGITGEGAMDLAEMIKNAQETEGRLTLKHSMPTAICGYCYGNRIVDPQETLKRYLLGKDLKTRLPNLNCGKCGFKSCNEFIRAVLDGKASEDRCPYVRSAAV